jgi:DDE family transposase
MCSSLSLNDLIRFLLPQAGRCGHAAAVTLVQAMRLAFTTVLTDLARKTGRNGRAKITRTWLARWLARDHWDPETIYQGLNRHARRLLERRAEIPLLVDFTDLGRRWRVLQVSLPWEGRALPLYRSVVSWRAPETAQPKQVQTALAWLKQHLPGRWERYVIVMDRGFPSHRLIRVLQQAGFRFVVRAPGEWKMTHPEYTGRFKEAVARPGLVGARARGFRDAVLGQRGKGAGAWSRANVVLYHGEGCQEPWYLLTTERTGARAVAIYRERMKIEGEFRDVKGPLGLDRLARWQDREAVARLLAMVAIYEWRLAYLWLSHRLWEWRAVFQVHGKLSWITITRLWIQHQLLPLVQPALACL